MIRLGLALVVALAVLTSSGEMMTFSSAPHVALAQEPELQDGDLLVGVHDGRGAIVRIRGGVATRYCIAQDNPGEPMFFDTPKELVIDSRGDVVFLAYMSTSAAPASLGPYGLWRCSAMGQPPELIGAFGTRPEFDHPRPLGDRPVRWAGGLHIKRAAGVNLNTGEATTTEWYVFIVTDSGDGHRDTIAFSPALNTWADTGVMEDPIQPAPAAGYFQFDMINGGSGHFNYTVSAAGNAMKVVAEPISIEAEWNGVLTAKLAFQSVRELVGATVDDLSVDNADPHDCFSPYPGTPRNAFGTANGMAGINALAWPGTLLMQSDSFGMGHPFVPLQTMALFNLDPADDAGSLYTWPLDCSVWPKLLFNPWHPFNSYNDASGLPRSVDVLAPGGTVGTQRFDDRVIGIGPSQDVVVLAEGLNRAPYVNPTGVDVYPGYRPNVAGQSIFVRIDSPVNVVITDAAGRRLGIDASGNVVNDFGAEGFDSATEEPRVFGIRRPTSGDYRVETVGTGSGPYHVTVFGVDHATLEVSQAQFAGQAEPGSQSSHEFAVDESGRVSSEPEGDHEPPVIADHRDVAVLPESRSGTVVTYDLPPATDNSGVATVTCAPASGTQFPIGATKVTCTAVDPSGNSSQSEFDVVVGCCKTRLRVGGGKMTPGSEIRLNAVVRNLSTMPQSAELRFDVIGVETAIPPVAITVAPRARSRVRVPWRLPENLAPGGYTVRMTLVTSATILEATDTFIVKQARR